MSSLFAFWCDRPRAAQKVSCLRAQPTFLEPDNPESFEEVGKVFVFPTAGYHTSALHSVACGWEILQLSQMVRERISQVITILLCARGHIEIVTRS